MSPAVGGGHGMTGAYLVAYNRTRARELAPRVELADGLRSRLVGLLGRSALGRGEGLWLVPCAQVHMFFMRFPIDVVFLDRERRVVSVVRELRPWRVSPWVRGAHSALELPAGSTAGAVDAGDALEMR